MKIKHIWSVLCKESVINQDDNTLYLHGLLEELTIALSSVNKESKPREKVGIPINYEIVSLWFKDKKEEIVKAEVEYTLISPEGSELLKTTQQMEMPRNVRRFRSRMKIAGMPITKDGDYSFQIKIKESEAKTFTLVSKLPLEVKVTRNISSLK